MKPCPFAARHWFAYYGRVHSSSPVCVRCGETNPRYRPDDDDATWDPGVAAFVAAVTARRAERATTSRTRHGSG